MFLLQLYPLVLPVFAVFFYLFCFWFNLFDCYFPISVFVILINPSMLPNLFLIEKNGLGFSAIVKTLWTHLLSCSVSLMGSLILLPGRIMKMMCACHICLFMFYVFIVIFRDIRPIPTHKPHHLLFHWRLLVSFVFVFFSFSVLLYLLIPVCLMIKMKLVSWRKALNPTERLLNH